MGKNKFFRKRVTGVLLIVLMLICMLPQKVSAAEGRSSIHVGATQLEGVNDFVYFGDYYINDPDWSVKEPVKWRVVSTIENGVTSEDGIFLFADTNLCCRAWNAPWDSNITWENSHLRSYLNGEFSDEMFSDVDKEAILDTTLENPDNIRGQDGGNDTVDKIFLLLREDIENEEYFPDMEGRVGVNTITMVSTYKFGLVGKGYPYWLRNLADVEWPGCVAVVNEDGIVETTGQNVEKGQETGDIAVRPALNLSKDAILFTSSAGGGKSALNQIAPVVDYDGNEWRLTLKDQSRSSFNACLNKGETKTWITYEGAVTGTTEYISVILADEDSNITHYGRLQVVKNASGNVELDLSAIDTEGKTLYVFNEQYNGGLGDADNKVDYASDLVELDMNIDVNASDEDCVIDNSDDEADSDIEVKQEESSFINWKTIVLILGGITGVIALIAEVIIFRKKARKRSGMVLLTALSIVLVCVSLMMEGLMMNVKTDETKMQLAYDFGGNETVAQYRDETDGRIEEIRTIKSDIQPAEGGTAYYFSNNGNSDNDGKSPKRPLATLDDLAQLTLKAGDVVYFECGSVWRGYIEANVEGVTYTSYGKGEKPMFYASPENGSGDDKWEKVGENIYKYHEYFKKDVGGVVFNEGEYWGVKKIPVQLGSKMVDNATGESFSGYADLKQNFDFYFDMSNGQLYVYYDGGNPGNEFESIEFCAERQIIKLGREAYNVVIDNLCFKYCGGMAITMDFDSVGVSITNCEMGWLGGALMLPDTDNPVRFGNAIQIWGGAKDFLVENCYFYQIYDAAITWQYSSQGSKIEKIAENVVFRNNVMDYCNYSIEYFFSEGDIEDTYMKDIEFSGNQMWFAGEGFCAQRPDISASHIKSWTHANNIAGDFIIKNNLFAYSSVNLLETYSVTGISPDYSDNIYIQHEGGLLGFTGGQEEGILFTEENVTDVFGDKTAEIITTK